MRCDRSLPGRAGSTLRAPPAASVGRLVLGSMPKTCQQAVSLSYASDLDTTCGLRDVKIINSLQLRPSCC